MTSSDLTNTSAARIRMKMDAEWRSFEERLPYDIVKEDGSGRSLAVGGASHPVYPHPTKRGGLPVGWNIRWSAPYEGRDPDGTYETFVIERAAGGWTLAFHMTTSKWPRVPKTNLWSRAAATVEELYAQVVAEADAKQVDASGVENNLRDYIVTRYDMTDATEEAEAVLVGLGARVTVFPRALVE